MLEVDKKYKNTSVGLEFVQRHFSLCALPCHISCRNDDARFVRFASSVGRVLQRISESRGLNLI